MLRSFMTTMVTHRCRGRWASPLAAALAVFLALPALAQPVSGPATSATPGDRVDLRSEAPAAGLDSSLDAATLERIMTLLSGYEYFPTAQDLTGVVSDPVPYLLHIAYDPDGRWIPLYHHRAVGALAYFPTEVTRAHLEYLLTSSATPELMRHHVINAYANGFGDEALSRLEPYLYDDDLQLRLTAVAAIGAVESNRSVELLQTALLHESHELVQQRIQSALTSEPLLRFQ